MTKILPKLPKPLIAFSAVLLSLGMASATAAPNFYDDYNRAVAAAKAENNPMVVVFSATWCGPCQQMKKAVYPSAPVASYHNDFVWVYIDIDDPNNAPVVSQNNVSLIPHISFQSASGKTIDTLKGAVMPDKFAEQLGKVQRKTGKGS